MTEDANAGGVKILEPANAEEEAAREKLDKRIDAVNASSSTARNSWVFFLGLMAYLAVVTAGVTHKDLLLDNQIKLTALGELSLSRFFAFAPLAFLIIYVGLLLQLSSLADKARALNAEISTLPEDTVGSRRHQHPLRDNISTFMITQALAGRRVSRDRMFLMQATSWVTLAALPVLLLLFFQVTYLPYHDQEATFWHQLFVVAGAIFATRYVPEIMQVTARTNAKASRIDRALRISFSATFVGIGLFSFFIATVPDSLLDRATRWAWPTQVPMGWSRYTRPVFPLTALFFEGDSNNVTGTPSSKLSRNLVVIDSFKEEVEKLPRHLSLRGRDLKYAIFDRSDFTGADFTGTRLDGARFGHAVLKNAVFGCGSLTPSKLSQLAEYYFRRLGLEKEKILSTGSSEDQTCAILQYASFVSSDLTGSTFNDRKTAKAKLDHAKFSGASMSGANFAAMNLTGSSFAGARLQKASFESAILLGASFAGASAEESVFDDSNLVLADMSSGVFDRSAFSRTQLILSDAQSASFLGANLTNANLYGTHLAKSLLWGAKAPNIRAFAFGDLTNAKLDLSEIPNAKRPAWLNSSGELEAKWRSSSDRDVLKAARGILSDKSYAFFQSAIPFARSTSCETEVQFIEELVFKFEQNMGGSDFGGYDPNSARLLSFDDIARETQGFSEIVKRLGTAFGHSLTEYNPDTFEYYGTTDIYWDWDPVFVTGDPKPFLDSLKAGNCPTAEKHPEIWKALTARLEIASQDYANRPKRRELTSSPGTEAEEERASPQRELAPGHQ